MAVMCMHCHVLIVRLRLCRETVALLQTGLQVHSVNQEAQGVGGGFVYSPGAPSQAIKSGPQGCIESYPYRTGQGTDHPLAGTREAGEKWP